MGRPIADINPIAAPDEIDLERDYYRNRGWFFGLLAAAAVASLVKDLALEGQLPELPNLIFHFLLIATCGIAMATFNRTYHTLLAPISLALFVGYVALLFARL